MVVGYLVEDEGKQGNLSKAVTIGKKDTNRKENQFVVYKENIYVIRSNGELGLHKPFGIGAHSCFASFGLNCAIAYESRDEYEGPKMGELIIKCDQG